MEKQTNLFEVTEEAVYCFDTCAFLNVLQVEDQPYAMDVMEGMYDLIEQMCNSGKIVSVTAVHDELKKWEDRVPGLKEWLKRHKDMFLPLDIAQVQEMTPIVQKYEVYASDKGDYGDVCVIGFAKSRKLKVVTSEVRRDQHRMTHPKIPNVCDEFDVECTNLIGYLRDEGAVMRLVINEPKKDNHH